MLQPPQDQEEGSRPPERKLEGEANHRKTGEANPWSDPSKNKGSLWLCPRSETDTITWYYFASPKIVAFHNLTNSKAVLQIAKHVLGLSRKFISVRYQSVSADEMNPSLESFERDCHLKVFFAGNPLDHKPPPLYVKSKWRPPYESIPLEIQNRLSHFFKKINKMFK